MEEAQKISRRTLLKLAGLAGLATATSTILPTKAQPTPSTEKEEIPARPILQIPGEFILSLRTEQAPAAGQREILSALPEKEDKSRMWAEDKPAHAPPPSYRSALAYDSKNDRWVLHGGYIGRETNHNQTWAYKNGDWTKLEEGSTKAIYGHSIIDTPAGLVMFGGIEILPNKRESVILNEFRILKEDANGTRWEKFVPETPWNKPVPALLGIGSVYDKNTKSIWILGGASFAHNRWWLSDVTYQLYLPGQYSQEKSWYFRGVGYQGYDNFDGVANPLAFMIPGDAKIYLHGGSIDRGDGIITTSNNLWMVAPTGTNIEVTRGNWPRHEYARSTLGGFDQKSNQLVLLSGYPTSVALTTDFRESVVYDPQSKSWARLVSLIYPPMVWGAAVGMNPKTGEFLRFGGASYNWNTKEWDYSHQTWRCSPVYTLRLPVMRK